MTGIDRQRRQHRKDLVGEIGVEQMPLDPRQRIVSGYINPSTLQLRQNL